MNKRSIYFVIAGLCLMACGCAGSAGRAVSDYERGLKLLNSEDPDIQKSSLPYFRAAAEGKYIPAEMKLSELYCAGTVVEQDDITCLKWIRAAAEHGDPDAQYQLAGMFEHGKIVPQNHDLATTWYVKAAENLAADPELEQNAHKQYVLGQIYANGWSGTPAEGKVWLEKAAENGESEAVRALKEYGEFNSTEFLCSEGNCPCGDDFCAKGAVCVEGGCVCGPQKQFARGKARTAFADCTEGQPGACMAIYFKTEIVLSQAGRGWGEYSCVHTSGDVLIAHYICEHAESCGSPEGKILAGETDITDIHQCLADALLEKYLSKTGFRSGETVLTEDEYQHYWDTGILVNAEVSLSADEIAACVRDRL